MPGSSVDEFSARGSALPPAVMRAIQNVEARLDGRLTAVEGVVRSDHDALFGRKLYDGDEGLTGQLLDNERQIRRQLGQLQRLAQGILVSMLLALVGVLLNIAFHVKL